MPLTPAIRPVEQHQQDGGEPDQGAADGGRHGSEIGHDGDSIRLRNARS